jgi:hypothetical protein
MHLQLRYVPGIMGQIFDEKNRVEFMRFKHFTIIARQMLDFCGKHNEEEIRSYLLSKNYSFYKGKKDQLFAVDPRGSIVIRIKNNGQTTISFPTKPPFIEGSQTLDMSFLYDRTSECLKFVRYKENSTYFIPISERTDIATPWVGGISSKGKTSLMGAAHTFIPADKKTISARYAAPAA